jgi:hypothetical protein
MDSESYIYVTDSGKSRFRADYDCNQKNQIVNNYNQISKCILLIFNSRSIFFNVLQYLSITKE